MAAIAAMGSAMRRTFVSRFIWPSVQSLDPCDRPQLGDPRGSRSLGRRGGAVG